MAKYDLSPLRSSLEVPPWLAERATSLLDRVRAIVAPIAGDHLGDLRRLGADAWRDLSAWWQGSASPPRERAVPIGQDRPAIVSADPAPDPAVLDALLTGLAAAPRWEERAEAAATLALSDAAPVVPALVRALRDPSVEVALAAVDALRCRADPAANAALRGVLGNVDGYFHSIVRAAAVTALARSLPPTGLDPVLEAVRDRDADVSMAALSAIGEHAPSLLLGHALTVLRDRSGYYLPAVRLAAAQTLERAGLLSAELAEELQPAEPDPALFAVLERVVR